jgi:hypothetical protein
MLAILGVRSEFAISDSAIEIVFLVGVCFGMLQAALMLVSPAKHRRFNNWISTLGRHSRFTTVDPPPGRSELLYRVAGLIILCICVGLAGAAISALREPTGQVTPVTPTEHARNLGANWLPFVIGPVAILFGLFCALRPSAATKWGMRYTSIRSTTPIDDRKAPFVMVLFGLCFVVFGIFMLWLGLHNFWHVEP